MMKLIYSLPRNGKKLTGWKYKNAVKFISFCELYDYWNDSDSNRNNYLSDTRLICFETIIYHFSNPSFHITDYLDPDLIDSVYIPRLIDMKNDWERGLIEKELIPIGTNSFNQYLMLGVGEENADKIYYESRSEDKIELLSDNIFEYFTKIEVVPKTSYSLPHLNVLYKNWGENFWRIREEA